MSSRNPSPHYQPCPPKKSKSKHISLKSDSGQVIVRVQLQLEGHQKHKKKCNKHISRSAVSKVSNISSNCPPENLTTSQKRLLDALRSQVSKKAISEDLKAYIKTLLSMSRDSISELNVATSSTASAFPEVVRSREEMKLQEDMLYLSTMTEKYADKVNELVDMFDRLDSPQFTSEYLQPPRLHTLQSQTKLPGPSHCPPVPQPEPHISSECRYCQPTGGRERTPLKVRPKTPPPRTRHGHQTGAGPSVGYPGDSGQSNYRETHPCPPVDPARHPDHPPANTTQHPCSPTTPQSPPNQSSRSPNQSPAPPPSRPGTSSSPYSSKFRARAKAIQTPLSLSSNLLPHPREYFGQQAPCATSTPTGSPNTTMDDSMRRMFEVDGVLHPPPSNVDPNQLAADYRRQHMPNEDTIRTPNDSFDMQAFMADADARFKITSGGSQNKSTNTDCIGTNSAEKSFEGFDPAFENGAMSQPVNNDKIDSIRRKLKKMNEEQYKAVLEMLQKGAACDRNIIEFYKNQMNSCLDQESPETVRSDGRAMDNLNVTAPPKLASQTDRRVDNLATITIMTKNRTPKC